MLCLLVWVIGFPGGVALDVDVVSVDGLIGHASEFHADSVGFDVDLRISAVGG